jgi:hypothetical protein
MKRKLGFAATVGALLLALTLVLTACGGDGDSDGVASLGDTTGQSTTENDNASKGDDKDPQDAALEYAKCMREHGVDMPDPGPNGELQLQVGPGDNRKKVEEAQRACQDILEDARPKLSEEQQSILQDALLAFAKCMREHGVDMPDPQFGEGGMVIQRDEGRGGVNPDDPKFQTAAEACEPIMDEARRKAGLPEGRPGFQRSGGDS